MSSWESLYLSAVLFAVLALSLRPFFRPRGTWPYDRARSPLRERLADQRDAALRALKDVDFEHQSGKMSDDDAAHLRAGLHRQARRALATLAVLDEAEGEIAREVAEARRELEGEHP